MLFNSYEFIFAFLPATFLVYTYLNRKRLTEASKGFLVFCSLFFYSWWNIAYLPIILSSMLFNYVLGNSLAVRSGGIKGIAGRRFLLIFGVASNLVLLGYFKYTVFFIENVNLALGTKIGLLHLALPLAISFFTFQQIAYLVDSYREETNEYDFLNYAVFVSFFPQLIAGPIVYHREMMPQFADIKSKVINYRNISRGLFIFSIGLFKKAVIADTFSLWATVGFDEAVTLSFIEAWTTSLSYTFQLYFDFSGYTDMAIGLALLFNIWLPINFNSPYKAVNIQDFWRRWHITLSRFLKDYLYIPLGGNRVGPFRTYSNLMATFLLGGIWHGAGWTFVFWGFMHGLALSLYRLWSRSGLRLWTWLAWLATFNFVNIGWVFFRAENWGDAAKVLGGMLGLQGVVLPLQLAEPFAYLGQYGILFGGYVKNLQHDHMSSLWIVAGFVLVFGFKNSVQQLAGFRMNFRTAFLASTAFAAGVLSLNKVSEFLYFNF